jgi:uncharacterized protein
MLFAHWPVPQESLRRLVPEPLEIDTFDGAAWVGLIPFTMPRFRVAGLSVPGMSRFHECNVRTYVRCSGGGGCSGVYFFSLDAASRLAVWGARKLWRLNYFLARMDLRRDGDVVHYRFDRADPPGPAARLRCAWRMGSPRPLSRPGELDHFLTERYALYTVDAAGRPLRGRIRHEQWRLHDATLLELEETLLAAAGIDRPGGEPLLYHAQWLDVAAWNLERAPAPPQVGSLRDEPVQVTSGTPASLLARRAIANSRSPSRLT